MNIRRWINGVLGKSGYHIVRAQPDIVHDVERGRYDWLRRRRIATVLDVGANVGQFARMIRLVLPEARIHSFEPVRTSFNELSLASESLQPMTCYCLGLGSENGSAVIHRNAEHASSSILAMRPRHGAAFPSATPVADERIEIRTLDGVAPELGLTPSVLLKIDVQGYELNVLKGAVRTLSEIDMLIVETSFTMLYDGQPLFDDIYRFLRENGFEYAGSLGTVADPSTGEILQEDSIFFSNRGRTS